MKKTIRWAMLCLLLCMQNVWPMALPDGVFALQGIDEALPVADLAPFDAVIGNAQIIALGESVHTSGGYYQAKFRLIKHLVEDMGVRAVTIESPWGEAYSATRYVATCQGTPIDAVKGLFGVWQSTEMVNMLQWLCTYNRQHPDDPVVFFGFDIQQPAYDGHHLRTFLQQSTPNDWQRLTQGLDHCFGAKFDSEQEFWSSSEGQSYINGTPLDPTTHRLCLAALDQLDAYIAEHWDALVSSSNLTEVTWMQISARGLRAWEEEMFYYNFSDDDANNIRTSFEVRDLEMARTFDTIRSIQFPNKKTIIWAHNAHIAENLPQAFIDHAEDYSWKNMGTALKESHGADYAAIGLIGYQVEINWPGYSNLNPPLPTASDSLELQLHGFNQPYLFVGTTSPFLQKNAIYEVNVWHMIPAEQFKGLVFLDYSYPMKYWWQDKTGKFNMPWTSSAQMPTILQSREVLLRKLSA